MGLLQDLMGGGKRRDEYEDFLNRYEKGQPWDNISDGEAVDRYREFATNLPDEEYMAAAQEAFQRLSPEQRREFARFVASQARERQLDFVDRDMDGRDDRYQDPAELARMTRRMQQRDPDLMAQIFGGSGQAGGMMSNPIAKAAMAGIAAMAFKRMMGGRR